MKSVSSQRPRPRKAAAASPRATVHDVAKRAGVSPATVSRVLNGTVPVLPQTAALVQRAARELGFRPNLLGRQLRAQRTRHLGVVLPTLAHPVFAECLQELTAAARAKDHGVVPVATGYDPAQEDGAVEFLLRQRVDALVLTVADAARSRVLDKLDREQVPYVLVYNQLSLRRSRAERTAVSVDNRAAARDAVAHLIGLGHRRIAMVAGQFRQSDRARLRWHGYADAMRAAGLVAQPAVQVPFMSADARLPLVELMHARARPTALFCASDQLALVVMHDLARLRLRVPEDVSVAGFDGVAIGALLNPALTSVVQPSPQIAATALTLLLARLAGDAVAGRVLLPHALRMGGTTAAPGAPSAGAYASPHASMSLPAGAAARADSLSSFNLTRSP
jgi:DNA-binding LacI/PurR family transcriptional regulator